MTTTEHRTDHSGADLQLGHVGAVQDSGGDQASCDAQIRSVAVGPTPLADQTSSGAHACGVSEVSTSPVTKASPMSTSAASPGNPDSVLDQPPTGAQETGVEGGPTSPAAIARSTSNAGTSPGISNGDSGHPPCDTHGPAAAVAPNSALDHSTNDAHGGPVEGGPTRPPAARSCPAPSLEAPLVDPHLSVLAELLNDLEDLRKANVNRLEVMTRVGFDADGKERGFGMPKDAPAVLQVTALVAELKKVEDHAQANLEKALKASPLGPWVVAQRGLGLKTIARLLGATGDPYWNHLHGRPRTVSELRSYCGYGDASKQLRRKGEKTNWSPTAKMRLHNIVEPIKKMIKAPCHSEKDEKGAYLRGVHIEGECTCSPYRVLWDEARAKYAGSVHPESCLRCGPAGHPALAGSPRSAAHQQALADRLVKKRILRDLWREAKRLHELPGGQSAHDVHIERVAGVSTSTE